MPSLIDEKELESHLCELHASNCWPFRDVDFLMRQLKLKGYGVADLVSVSILRDNNYSVPIVSVIIYELKKGDIDLNAVGQISRYRTAIIRMLKPNCGGDSNRKYYFEVNGVLIGGGYTGGDVCYAVDNIDWLRCYHFDIDLFEGMEFHLSEGWYSTEENTSKIPNFRLFVRKFVEIKKSIDRNKSSQPESGGG